MQKETESISSKAWERIDERAKKHNMNRSQFINHCFETHEKKHNRPSLVEVAMLLGLALVVVLIMVVK